MKKYCLNLMLAVLLFSGLARAEATGFTMETHATSEHGTTYRVYATFDDPADWVSSVYGLTGGEGDLPMSLLASAGSSIFQANNEFSLNPNFGQDVNTLFFGMAPDTQYDSWLTIGTENSSGDGGVQGAGLTEALASFNAGTGFDNCGGAWFVASLSGAQPDWTAGDDLKVLLAQITMTDDESGNAGHFTFQFNLQYKTGTGPAQHFFGGLVNSADFIVETDGCMDEGACNYSATALTDDGSCIFPELHYDCDGNCVNDSDGDGICDELEYPLFDLNGDEIVGTTDLLIVLSSFGATEESYNWVDLVHVLIDSGVNDENVPFDAGWCWPEDFVADPSCSVSAGDFLELSAEIVATDMPEAGYRTFRVYANFSDSIRLIGTPFGPDLPIDASSDSLFYQHFGGSSLAHEISLALFQFFPNLWFDSWLSLGNYNCCSGDFPIPQTINITGVPTYNFEAGLSFTTESPYGGAIYHYGEEFFTHGPILLGQFTTQGNLSFTTNLLWKDAEGMPNFVSGATIQVELEDIGCLDPEACDYDSTATISGPCAYPDEGFDCVGNCDPFVDENTNGVCDLIEVPGCLYPNACNFNPAANVEDGSCLFYCPGCMDDAACNYDPIAQQDDGSCVYPEDVFGVTHLDCAGQCENDSDEDGVCDEDEVLGCTDPQACSFESSATDEDGSCTYPEAYFNCQGECVNDEDGDGICDELDACPNDAMNDEDGDGICFLDEVWGCTYDGACNYDGTATEEDGTCIYPAEYYLDCSGECLNDSDGDGVCDEVEIIGCMSPGACNFDAAATDPGTCEYTSCAGCTYPFACNYDPAATISDLSCEFGNCAGCTDSAACNYNPTLSEDDGSCLFNDACGVCGGDWPAHLTCEGECLNDADGDGICDEDEVLGCTDSAACNYDATPTTDSDPSLCIFPSGCETCTGETNGTGTVIYFDSDDDGVCDLDEVAGCQDPSACNYNENATDSSACIYATGCDICSGEINGTGTVIDFDIDDDGVCDADEITGCTDPEACNYDATTTTDTDNTLCLYAVGCQSCSGEQDGSGVVVDNDDDGDGVCNADEIIGCTDAAACNYDATSTTDTDNTLCIYASGCDTCSGETDGSGTMVDNDQDDDGVCDPDEMTGCTDADACNYDATPTTDSDNTMCEYPVGCDTCSGETDGTGTVVDNDADDDGVCDPDEVAGCQDPDACNYDDNATDSSACVYATGCDTCTGETDGSGTVLDNDADNDGICNEYEIAGCQDLYACNYNAFATDPGICTYTESGYDCDGNCINDADGDGVCDEFEIAGCQDESACNFDASATDPGICTYAEPHYDCDGECINDADGDGFCDESDYPTADMNGDSSVDVQDLLTAFQYFGMEVSADQIGTIFGWDDTFDWLDMFNVLLQQGFVEGQNTPYEMNWCLPEAIFSNDSCSLSLADFVDLSVEVVAFNAPSDGYTTFRVYANFANDISFYGMPFQQEHPISVASDALFYQDPAGASFFHEINPILLSIVPDLAFDSWLALGEEFDASLGTPDYFGFVEGELNDFNAGLTLSGNSSVGGGIFYIQGREFTAGPILLGQFTTQGNLSFTTNLLWKDAEGMPNFVSGATIQVELEDIGCLDPEALDFDPNATISGPCIYSIPGCMDEAACNYNSEADEPDDCVYPGACDTCSGATDGSGVIVPNDADEDGVCDWDEVVGCQDEAACNFSDLATHPGTCEYPEFPFDCEGMCINDNDDDGVCDEVEIPGCQVLGACNYDPEATDSDGSCTFPPGPYGCDGNCLNDSDGDGVCNELEVGGCQDGFACNYNPAATDSDGSCFYPFSTPLDCEGNCYSDADSDGVCDEFELLGCTDLAACNYDATPTTDSDPTLCIFPSGCDACSGETDGTGTVVDGDANDNGVCDAEEVWGCTYPAACNFLPEANVEDASCVFPDAGLDCLGNCLNDANQNQICDELELSYLLAELSGGTFCAPGTVWSEELQQCIASGCPSDLDNDGWIGVSDLLTLLGDFGYDCSLWGCTDPEASNFDADASVDDGSCAY